MIYRFTIYSLDKKDHTVSCGKAVIFVNPREYLKVVRAFSVVQISSRFAKGELVSDMRQLPFYSLGKKDHTVS